MYIKHICTRRCKFACATFTPPIHTCDTAGVYLYKCVFVPDVYAGFIYQITADRQTLSKVGSTPNLHGECLTICNFFFKMRM